MTKFSSLSLTALFASSALAVSASAATIEIYTASDGYIRASQTPAQTLNVVNNVLLFGDATLTDELRGVINFDLGAPELAGATINSITLKLHIASKDADSINTTETIQLLHLTESFTQADVSWTSRDGVNNWTNAGGTFDPTPLQTLQLNPSTVTTNMAVDIGTSAGFVSVANSAIGGQLNLLLKLQTLDSSRSLFRFHAEGNSTNAQVIAMRPYLVIDYTTAIPEPSGFAAVAGLAFLGFAGVRRRR